MSVSKKSIIPEIDKPPFEDDKKLQRMIKDSLSLSETNVESTEQKIPRSKFRDGTKKLGTCYKNIGCKKEDVLLRNVTKRKCKEVGGKSWKGKNGCEQISD